MRILMVSHPPLSAESGAAQIALLLAAALTGRGHDAVVWSPEPLPAAVRWWDRWRAQRRAIESYATAAGPWDVIEVPGISASPRLARLAPLVAREVQPELLYAADGLRAQLRASTGQAGRALLHLPYLATFAAALRRGWGRARIVACLGSRDLHRMRRRHPGWRGKLRSYVVAPAPAEREAFARVRRERRPGAPEAGTRFLWIGRWVAHKGTDRLLAFVRERAAAFPDDRFTVAGCGPAAARDCPPALLAEGRLRLVPAFRREELPALLAGHDVGLFSSRVEGWGLCLNEMLEAGLPVAATPAGGVEDLRPFWEPRLLPFPPAGEIATTVPEPADLDGYLAAFSWDEIARRYEEEVLLPCAS
jgi:glycosyltransferase involved in cell wall biosynthesis